MRSPMLTSGTSNCLVTGGAGFIGSHLAERLVALGHEVRVVDNLSTGNEANLADIAGDIEFLRGDLCDIDVCRRAVAGMDVVFHVAALPSVPRSLKDPWASHAANVNATVRLLEACVEAKVARIVYSSSSSVYGDTPVLPKTETTEPLPRSPYAASKLRTNSNLFSSEILANQGESALMGKLVWSHLFMMARAQSPYLPEKSLK